MEKIIARQNSAAKPATGKTFVVGIAAIILQLAAAQLAVNLLISLTGMGLFNILFYLFAVALLIRFMTRTVAGCIYTLRDDALVLQRLLGDSTVLGVEIPLTDILSIRTIVRGERLSLDYRQVTYVDPTLAPGLRMHAAFAASLVFTGLARLIAGKKVMEENGTIVAFMSEGKRCAAAFRPDADFAAALAEALPEQFGADERLTQGKKETYAAHSLRRAFPQLYPQVPDVVTQEECEFEREEFARRREERIAREAKVRKIPLDRYKAQLAKKERMRAARVKACRQVFTEAGNRLRSMTLGRKKRSRSGRQE